MVAPADLNRRRFDTPGDLLVLWGGIFAGPVAWLLDLTISYALVPWVCGGGPHLTLHLISLATLLIIAAGAWGSYTALGGAAPPDERGRFMAILGLALCAMFAAVILAGAIPRWVLGACLQ